MTDRILVVRPGALGDTILALPALQALAASHAPASLELVGYPAVAGLVRHAVPSLPVDRIHSVDRALFAPLFSGDFSEELRRFLGGFDLVIAWVYDRAGELRRALKSLSSLTLQADPYPAEGSGIHASLHLVGTLAPLGRFDSKRSVGPPCLAPPRDAMEECGRLLRGLGLEARGFLAIHPGSGSVRKDWPADGFAAVLSRAAAAGRTVLVLEGESDGEAVRRLGQSAGRPLTRVRVPSLPTLAAMVSRAAAFLGNDSGVSHLAAAAGTPTLVMFGPTDPAIWAPRGPRVRVLGFDTPAERVWAELDRLLSGRSHEPEPSRGKPYEPA